MKCLFPYFEFFLFIFRSFVLFFCQPARNRYGNLFCKWKWITVDLLFYPKIFVCLKFLQIKWVLYLEFYVQCNFHILWFQLNMDEERMRKKPEFFGGKLSFEMVYALTGVRRIPPYSHVLTFNYLWRIPIRIIKFTLNTLNVPATINIRW